ncbi:MAG: octanoyltransferase [Phycisphaerae bacterium]
MTSSRIEVRDLGRASYADAYTVQQRVHDEVLAWRDVEASPVGVLLLVEHTPVITVSKRATASANLIATPELLARHGVEVADTDRGGDITYHGPGQLVAYPILDLNRLGLGLHAYMRLLEECVIRTIARFGLAGERDSTATGVWVKSVFPPARGQMAKIAAMGVRVRKWISMHGLALNVDPNMDHFGLIVPCGLVGRPVTSMARELPRACPSFGTVKDALAEEMALEISKGTKQQRDI